MSRQAPGETRPSGEGRQVCSCRGSLAATSTTSPDRDALARTRSCPTRAPSQSAWPAGARVTRAAGLRHAPAPAARGVRRPEPPAGLGHVTPTRLRGTTLESIQKLGVSAQVTPGSGPPACPRGHLPAGGRAGASCWGESPAPGLPWALSTRVTSRQVAEALLGGRPWLRREARAGLKPCRTVSDGRDAPERVRLHPRGRPPALPPAAALGHGPAAGRVRAAPAPRRRWASRQVPSDEHGSRGPPTRPSVSHTHTLVTSLPPSSPPPPSSRRPHVAGQMGGSSRHVCAPSRHLSGNPFARTWFA